MVEPSDTFYPLPEGVEVEVRNVCHTGIEIGRCERDCDAYESFTKQKCTKLLAYVKPESQEKLWREAFELLKMNLGPINTQYYFTIINKHFTLIRNK